MRQPPERRENSDLLRVVATVVIIATLYFARLVFIPIALAMLVSLLLTPVVRLLERVKVPRIVAVFFVVSAVGAVIGTAGWQVSQQLVSLATELPTYKTTLTRKIDALKSGKTRSIEAVSGTVTDLAKEITAAVPSNPLVNENAKAKAVSGATPSRPLAVEVVPPNNPIESVQNVFGPLATLGLVTVFTIFMLLGREDLRNRFIRLVGRKHLNVTTQAIDETTGRIHRYLALQLAVNVGYGLAIGTALHFIGVTDSFLWGLVATTLRFLPYAGPPMAALPPILLSLAIFPGWGHAFATLGTFVALEIVVANFVEPVLYGAHLGLSPLAILVAAVFWTLVWGFSGLLLSTPLTVCLVVLGRYVPTLGFLNILLGDEPVLPPHAQYYQRLLAADEDEAKQVLEQYLNEKSLEELYGLVIIPALNLAERDRHRNELDEDTQNFIYQSTREIVEDLYDLLPERNAQEQDKTTDAVSRTDRGAMHRVDVLCIPARDEADDLVALLLAHLLNRNGSRAQSLSIATTSEMLAQVAELEPEIVCISALPPFAVTHARALYLKLLADSSKLKIVLCLWNFAGDPANMAARLRLAGDHSLCTTLPQALTIVAMSSSRREVHAGTAAEPLQNPL